MEGGGGEVEEGSGQPGLLVSMVISLCVCVCVGRGDNGVEVLKVIVEWTATSERRKKELTC